MDHIFVLPQRPGDTIIQAPAFLFEDLKQTIFRDSLATWDPQPTSSYTDTYLPNKAIGHLATTAPRIPM